MSTSVEARAAPRDRGRKTHRSQSIIRHGHSHGNEADIGSLAVQYVTLVLRAHSAQQTDCPGLPLHPKATAISEIGSLLG